MSKINLKHLNVFFEELLVGVLNQDRELVYSFTYSKEWLIHPKKFQLSLAMPLQTEPFGNRITLSFFENLLPEGEARDTLEKSHHIQGTFDFLDEFGSDCAGAVIITHESVSPFKKKEAKEIKLDKLKIYKAIEQKKSVAELISEMDPGFLSIAGAQDKFAGIFRDNEFYLPINGRPTTHIIKVPINRSGVKESVYNEFYCMKLAKAIGFAVSDCFVFEKDGYPLFITERYDRFIDKNGKTHRIHQQDFCQAQGIVSEEKYEEKGGPTLKDNFELIKKNVTIKKRATALFNYLDWICFNLLIGNNDSHSKNLSFLLKYDKIELAPFYDLMCTAIYPKLKRNFSFKIGDRRDSSRIGKNQLEMIDSELGLKFGTMSERMQLIKKELMKHKDFVASEIIKTYPKAKIVLQISELIEDRCVSLKRQGL
jgi:serine/threonine-protein kinase HipA